MPVEWRNIHLPIAVGIDGKADPRALQPPSLAVCRDARFLELGGLQTRLPYAAMSNEIVGGGTIAEPRRLGVDGDALILFTDTDIYSWSARHGAWMRVQGYTAPSVTEEPVFTRSSDQMFCDRAELDGVAVTVWQEGGTQDVYVAGTDAVTGAVLLPPTTISDLGVTFLRPRVVAQASRFLVVVYEDNSNIILGIKLAPATLAADMADFRALVAGTTVVFSTGVAASGVYDIVMHGSTAYCAYVRGGTEYGVSSVTDALVVTHSTKAKLADRIALAVSPDGAQVIVVRHDSASNAIEAERIDATTLATIAFDVSLGAPATTTINQLTCAFRADPESGGEYRCFAFWSTGEDPDAAGAVDFMTQCNYVDTASGTGSAVTLCRRMGIGSRAFEYGNRIYVWLVFAGESGASGMGEPLGLRAQLQNTYVLYLESQANSFASPQAKAVTNRAGGFVAIAGHLPGVQVTAENEYTFCGVDRRIIQLGDRQTNYSDRGPRVVRLKFDDDEARRAVRLGRTLYITGGQIVQYDGEGFTEVGFIVYPWYFGTVTLGGGTMDAGTYSYKSTYSWSNARGDFERSTTATGTSQVVTANQLVEFSMVSLYVTIKHNARSAPAIEVWRTQANPAVDSPFHLVTSQDPTDTSNPNRYIANGQSAFAATLQDSLTDAELSRKETNPENGGILENLSPPPATIIAASPDRIFLAGIAGAPDQIWYSKLRGDGEIAAFHDALVIDLPPDGGPITAVAFHNETLIAFKTGALYALAGDGLDNAGDGQNYGPARLISDDVGAVSAEAVARTSAGLYFKSRKGWYRIPAGTWGVEYVGGPVADFDGDTIVAAQGMEGDHEVRILSTERMLVLDTLAGQWTERTITDGLDAVTWNGRHVVLTTDGARVEQEAFGGETYGLDVETAWIKTAELQGYQRIRWLSVLGEYRSPHRLRVRVAFDYSDTWVDDKTWTISPAIVGGPLQVRHGPSRQKCEAFKVRITAMDSTLDQPPTGEALKLTGLGLEVGIKRGLYKRLPAAQKQ